MVLIVLHSDFTQPLVAEMVDEDKSNRDEPYSNATIELRHLQYAAAAVDHEISRRNANALFDEIDRDLNESRNANGAVKNLSPASGAALQGQQMATVPEDGSSVIAAIWKVPRHCEQCITISSGLQSRTGRYESETGQIDQPEVSPITHI